MKLLAFVGATLLALGLAGCGSSGELSNADVAAKKAELNAGAPQGAAQDAQGDRGH